MGVQTRGDDGEGRGGASETLAERLPREPLHPHPGGHPRRVIGLSEHEHPAASHGEVLPPGGYGLASDFGRRLGRQRARKAALEQPPARRAGDHAPLFGHPHPARRALGFDFAELGCRAHQCLPDADILGGRCQGVH